MAHLLTNISRRSRIATVALLGAGALSFGAVPAASAGGTDELLRAVVPASVTDVAKPVTDAVAPVTDPVADAAAPVTTPVVEAAKPVVDPVNQAIDGPVATVAKPVERIAEPVTQPVAERVVEPVAKTAAPVADLASTQLVDPVAKRASAITTPVAERVVDPAAKAAAPVVEATTRIVGRSGDTVTSTVDDLEGGDRGARESRDALASRQPASSAPDPATAAPGSIPGTSATASSDPRRTARIDLRGDSRPSFAATDLSRSPADSSDDRTTPLPAPLAPSIVNEVGADRSPGTDGSGAEQREAPTTSVERRLPSGLDQAPVAPAAGLSGGSTASAGNGPLTGGAFAILPEPVEPVATTGLPTTFTPVAGWTPVTLVGEVHRPD